MGAWICRKLKLEGELGLEPCFTIEALSSLGVFSTQLNTLSGAWCFGRGWKRLSRPTRKGVPGCSMGLGTDFSSGQFSSPTPTASPTPGFKEETMQCTPCFLSCLRQTLDALSSHEESPRHSGSQTQQGGGEGRAFFFIIIFSYFLN